MRVQIKGPIEQCCLRIDERDLMKKLSPSWDGDDLLYSIFRREENFHREKCQLADRLSTVFNAG